MASRQTFGRPVFGRVQTETKTPPPPPLSFSNDCHFCAPWCCHFWESRTARPSFVSWPAPPKDPSIFSHRPLALRTNGRYNPKLPAKPSLSMSSVFD
ncbi:hypothetical protein LY78DRAFT_313194 [Colletotrichum sublineola]|nr:hypothetical protein LY78DRAFT_313194 [Colletotrichum sublineola]